MLAVRKRRRSERAEPTPALVAILVDEVQRELAGVMPIQTPAWLGCTIGSRITVMRDVASGQFAVLAGLNGGESLTFLEAGICSLFSTKSEWLGVWMLQRTREFWLARNPADDVWLDRDIAGCIERLSLAAGRRVRRSDLARRVSHAIPDACAVDAEDLALAGSLNPDAVRTRCFARFADVQLVLQHPALLRRVAKEHPKWLVLIAQRLRAGLLTPRADPMAQIKRFALRDGLSHGAWATLACSGPTIAPSFDESTEFSDVVRSASALDDVGVEHDRWQWLIAAAKAVHWVGGAWVALHPEFQRRIVKTIHEQPGSAERIERLLRAMGQEARWCMDVFGASAELENEFGAIVVALSEHDAAAAEDFLDFEAQLIEPMVTTPGIPAPPTGCKWDAWQRWLSKFNRAFSRPFWTPLENFAFGQYRAFALGTRQQLNEEGQRMRHCVATYVRRCMAGEYAVFAIRCGRRRNVATVGLHITVDGGPQSQRLATRVELNEIVGPDNDEVAEDVRTFAAQLLHEINGRLPQQILPPDNPVGWNASA